MASVVIFGAGAVGSLFGARLAARGEQVLLVGRPEHVAAIRADGLTVEGVEPGRFRLAAATGLPPTVRAEIVLLTVKAYDLDGAAIALGRALRAVPIAVLGNGLGLETVVGRRLREAGWERPERYVVRSVHTVPATLLGPGRVRASGTGEVVLPEPSSAGEAEDAVGTVIALFRRGGFEVRTSDVFELELWRKAVVNAAINPVTAALGVPNGALVDGPPRAAALELLGEAVEVAQRSGVELELVTATADLDRVVRRTAENRSSMLQDVDRGRPTELEAISGEIVRRAEQLGVAVPATRRAMADVRRAVADRSVPAQR